MFSKSKSWFFKHPFDANYGASPDRLTEAFSIGVKTRAGHSDSPLKKITGAHLVQGNLQMIWTEGQITFLQFYLPERKVANFLSSREMIP